jgi:hypothetical protein
MAIFLANIITNEAPKVYMSMWKKHQSSDHFAKSTNRRMPPLYTFENALP